MALGGAGGRGGCDQSTLQNSLRTTKKYTSHNVFLLGSAVSLTIFLYVCFWVHVHVSVGMHACLWVCLWKSETVLAVLLQVTVTLCFLRWAVARRWNTERMHDSQECSATKTQTCFFINTWCHRNCGPWVTMVPSKRNVLYNQVLLHQESWSPNLWLGDRLKLCPNVTGLMWSHCVDLDNPGQSLWFGNIWLTPLVPFVTSFSVD